MANRIHQRMTKRLTKQARFASLQLFDGEPVRKRNKSLPGNCWPRRPARLLPAGWEFAPGSGQEFFFSFFLGQI
jgi:hypothetical protein